MLRQTDLYKGPADLAKTPAYRHSRDLGAVYAPFKAGSPCNAYVCIGNQVKHFASTPMKSRLALTLASPPLRPQIGCKLAGKNVINTNFPELLDGFAT